MADEVVPIEVCKLEAALEQLLAPDSPEWDRAAETVVPVGGPPRRTETTAIKPIHTLVR